MWATADGGGGCRAVGSKVAEPAGTRMSNLASLFAEAQSCFKPLTCEFRFCIPWK